MATNTVAALDLDVRPLTSVIGAEVTGIDLREPLDPATVARALRRVRAMEGALLP